jgi:hypothetical protein
LVFYFLQWLSSFFNGFLTFFNGFLLSPTALQFSPTAFRFSSMAFHFPRDPRKSIYGKKYTKDRYSSFVFFATRSPSFVIPAKQYLRLTQQKHHSTCDEACLSATAIAINALVKDFLCCIAASNVNKVGPCGN